MTSIRTKGQRGFTIIETLVAITVLMIAIAGPLVVASKGLFGALASKDQLVASYLAQESMETVKNIKNNNLASSQSWLSGMDSCVRASGDTTTMCDASAIDSQEIYSSGWTGHLNMSASGYYTHMTGSPTIFTRYFYLSGPNCPNGSPQECTVTVVVDWNEGPTPYEVSISSEMTDTLML